MVDFDKQRLSRLRESIRWSKQRLQGFATRRMEALREYLGNNYGDENKREKVPVNLIELVINIYQQQLVARTPRALVTTHHRQLKPAAHNFGLALDQQFQEMDLRNTLWDAVLEAMFAMGIVKVGLNREEAVEIGGILHDVGAPFADVVAFDDYVVDMSVSKFEKVAYEGDRYRLPLWQIQQSSQFDESVTKHLTPDRDDRSIDDMGEDRSQSVSGIDGSVEEYHETVELLDLWLPQDGLFVTIPWSDNLSERSIGQQILRVSEWEGPERGPYHKLSFGRAPGNLIPTNPVSHLIDMHDLINRLWRKLGRQAERQKDVTFVRKGLERDGEAVIKANDGEVVGVEDPNSVGVAKFGGIDNGNMAFMLSAKDLFSWLGGNLDSLGGLSPSAETATQDQLIADSASKRMASMQEATLEFTQGIIKDIALYMWNDPLISIPYTKRVEGTDIELEGTWDETAKEGDFLEYNFKIEPYSMVHNSPSTKLQTINMVWTQYILPAMPVLQAQGAMPNVEGLLRTVAKYSDLSEIEDLVTFSGVSNMEQGPIQPQAAGKPATSHREYTRRNVSTGGTRASRDAEMAKALMGTGGNDDQKAAMMRPQAG